MVCFLTAKNPCAIFTGKGKFALCLLNIFINSCGIPFVVLGRENEEKRVREREEIFVNEN